jgi:outer membrane PBP1 activator LpoA protein
MQAKLRSARNAVAIALVAVLVAGCQVAGMPGLGGADAAERAERLAREGDHAGSARNYEAATKAAPAGGGNAHWLAAAGQWLQGGDVAAAENAAANVQAPLSPADAREQRRIDAEIALARGDTARAAEILRGLAGDDAAVLASRTR